MVDKRRLKHNEGWFRGAGRACCGIAQTATA
jgi:hypothetical protein